VPAVDRALRIFEILASQPHDAFSVSELAERSEMNISTCHSILLTLAEAGVLLRHEPMKTYTLGPTLIELGAAASEQYLGLPEARDALVRLTRKHGLAGAIGARANNEIFVVAHELYDGKVPATPQGFRAPMVPPLGIVFVAWDPEPDRQAWIERLGPTADESDSDRFRAVLSHVREKGYHVALDGTVGELALNVAQQLTSAASSEDRLRIAMDLAERMRRDDYAYASLTQRHHGGQDHISAGIFGKDETVALTMTLMGHPGDIPPEKVRSVASSLLDECIAITLSIGGVVPPGLERRGSKRRR